MQTYLFYDIETTGLNKAFDQILHFAAIRTDLALNELQRYEIKVKLNPDVVPSPSAMITHHMPLDDIANGISEYEAIQQIHRWLNEPGTLSIGYNSLGFDDEFLRFSFYRNLLPPYTHQYANQCGRLDLYPMTAFYFLFKNPILQWPTVEGKTSLKLEHLNTANQFKTGRSHHAMVDVEVTLELARQFFKEKEMWTYTTDYFKKHIDQERSQKLLQNKGLMVSGKWGAENYFQAPVLFLGPHRHYKNQMLWLQLDADTLEKTTPENLATAHYIRRKKLGEPGFILPLETRFLQHLTPERQERAERNQHWLNAHPALFQQIADYHCTYKYPVYPHTDCESNLYIKGFWSPAEEKICSQFHRATPNEKARLIEKSTPDLQALAIRLMGRHFPEAMTLSQKERYLAYCQQVNPRDETQALIDFKGQKRLTPLAALHESAILRSEKPLSEEQFNILSELDTYLHKQFSVSLAVL